MTKPEPARLLRSDARWWCAPAHEWTREQRLATRYPTRDAAEKALLAMLKSKTAAFVGNARIVRLRGKVTAPVTEAEVNRRVLARIRRMTPAEAFALSVSSGIHNPDGTLTPEYGGADPSPDGGKVTE